MGGTAQPWLSDMVMKVMKVTASLLGVLAEGSLIIGAAGQQADKQQVHRALGGTAAHTHRGSRSRSQGPGLHPPP